MRKKVPQNPEEIRTNTAHHAAGYFAACTEHIFVGMNFIVTRSLTVGRVTARTNTYLPTGRPRLDPLKMES